MQVGFGLTLFYAGLDLRLFVCNWLGCLSTTSRLSACEAEGSLCMLSLRFRDSESAQHRFKKQPICLDGQ